MTGRRVLLLLAASLASSLGPRVAEATAAGSATVVSSNWAGYAVRGRTYRRVSGTWTVPSETCARGSAGYSAAWVGLGGYSTSSRALEQIGTEADCSSSGRATYSAWSELVPANAVNIKMKVRPGDRISASVDVSGGQVVLRLRNRTRALSFTKKARMSAPDVSSAEWIVEAPSGCDSSGSCHQLPLADFGSVRFANAMATTKAGHAGTIADPTWSATKLNLSQSGASGQGFNSVSSRPGALASALATAGSSFAVTYEASGALGKPVATQPALKRG
jgi:hypothetical protein